jgi:glutathione peroxidase
MVRVHQKYRDQGFEILAFPCNQFMKQEPGTNAEIKAFARELYGAEFMMFEKTNVNGSQCCEVYKYLRRNSELFDAKKGEAKEIPWNFSKFLVDSEGKVISYHDPRISPNDLEKNIEAILKKAAEKESLGKM